MRADCLGYEGHPVLRTPNLDWLAERSVRFSHAYVQTAVCGPSRMCYYTGRYTHAHRSYWNGVPLPRDEITLADYARALGVRPAICGKTHYVADRVLEEVDPLDQREYAGFEPWEPDEWNGWHQYVRRQGYDELCLDQQSLGLFAVRRPDGVLLNGWRFEAAPFPTVIRDEDSETAYMTRRAMEFIDEAGDAPWLLHLSYIKPHWPLVAPAPYHNMYSPDSVPAPRRKEGELTGHPLLVPFREERRSLPLDDEGIWRQLRATYYGLIAQLDDYLGRLWGFLQDRDLFSNTLVVFTSDHGEYLGDHWLFEKELFYEQAIRVPLVIFDPDPAADSFRGSARGEFVESVDLLPTILEALGGAVPPRVQGVSLLPFLRGGSPAPWRDATHAEWDFRFYRTGKLLGLSRTQCHGWMIRDERYKFVHYNGLPDMLFDLTADPDEFVDLASDPGYADVRCEYLSRLVDWRQESEDNSRGCWAEARTGRMGVSVPDRSLEFTPRPGS